MKKLNKKLLGSLVLDVIVLCCCVTSITIALIQETGLKRKQMDNVDFVKCTIIQNLGNEDYDCYIVRQDTQDVYYYENEERYPFGTDNQVFVIYDNQGTKETSDDVILGFVK